MSGTFTINQGRRRFELETDGHIAFIDYRLSDDNVMSLTHTEVPAALGGKGLGSRIVEQALQYIKDNQYKLVPLCPFVAKFVRTHREWQSLLADDFKV